MDPQPTVERAGDGEGDGAAHPHLARLGARLGQLRRARGQSQHQVASTLNVAPSSYAGWERAEIGPRFEQVLALADLFGVTLDDLVGRERPAPAVLTSDSVTWRLAWNAVSEKKEQAAEIWRRLLAHQKRTEIARDLRMSVDDVDRLVQDLVLDDWLEIDSVERDPALEADLAAYFLDDLHVPRLRDVRVARIGNIDSHYARYVLLGHAAKAFLGTRQKQGALRVGGSLGLCGGFSVSRLVYAYRRGELPAGIRVRPIAVTPFYEQAGVSANSVVSALAYRHYDDSVEASELSFRSTDVSPASLSPAWRVVERVLDEARRVEIAVMGLGGPDRGALAQSMLDVQRDYRWATRRSNQPPPPEDDHSVGNILYQPIGKNGEILKSGLTDDLVCSIGLDVLQQMVEFGRRVAVLGVSAAKAEVARAAIVGGCANVLIIDDDLARALLAGPP